MAYFKVNGVDILPYIQSNGFTWTENDIDSPQAGRTLDGQMHRAKVCSKRKCEIQCIPLKTSDASVVLNAIAYEYVTVATDIDPKSGTWSGYMYNSTRPAACLIFDSDGNAKWDNIKFSLIEM